MSRVAEHLAELTGFRDRELLDVSLVTALKDLLQPISLAIYRTVGEAGDPRWVTRARVAPGEMIPQSDPLWAELETLPTLDQMPAHERCLTGGQAMALQGPPEVTLFPIATERDTVGVLELVTLVPLSDEQRRMVFSILRIFRNFEGLLDYSERDTLTGLLNRKTFDECFLRAAMPAPAVAVVPTDDPRRTAAPSIACLGVIDVDHFKRVNDTHGHLIGDEVLLLLSRLMRSSFRHHDQLFRFGGEEFVVLMRCARTADAATAFERLRRNVESYAFPRVGRITVSVGFAQLRPGDTPTGCFDRADRAIYHAKQNGRNQVHDHALLVAAGLIAEETLASDVELF